MDFTGNVKNPFLFDDPAPPADVGDAAANPFLNGGPFDYSATSYTGINPFSDQIDDSNAAGIFGDPMAYPTDMNPFGTIPDASQPFGAVEPQPQAELFGGPVPPMNQVSGDLFGEPMVPAAAPAVSHHASAPPPVPPAPHHPPVPPHPSVPPARPQPPASVASPVIDLMSDGPVMEEPHAAPGRPPPPRPPPPSKETKDLLQTVIGAMEATTDTLHEKLNTTRTPCPSPGSAVANTPSPTPDIQVTEPEKEPDSFSAIFGQTIDESDHEMEEPKTMVDAPPAPETSTTSEDIDLFGDMPSQKPKTKQDILSLFNKPQAQTTSQVDLLSGDLLTEGITAEDGETTQVKPVEGAIVETTQDAQPIDLLAGDDISETVAPPASTAVSKEAAPSEALSQHPLHGKVEVPYRRYHRNEAVTTTKMVLTDNNTANNLVENYSVVSEIARSVAEARKKTLDLDTPSISVTHGKLSSLTPKVRKFVEEGVRLCSPSKVHVCDGSERELRDLLNVMQQAGMIEPLPKYSNCWLARTDPGDVARVESRTFIVTKERRETIPTAKEGVKGLLGNWMSPEELKKAVKERFPGCMKGRTMYVVPFSMGPVGSPLSKIGIQLTDSPYVVASMRTMTRMGKAVLDALAEQDFVKCLHSVGCPLPLQRTLVNNWPCDPERTIVTHVPETSEIISFGSGYGGNSLLGKKCFALRIGSTIARREGWLAEHMLILGITNPQGVKKYIAAAFPSACGKTNLAMMTPSLPGYKVECVGDDIAWMKFDEDGVLRAINPENGFFGVAPGTSMHTNPVAMQTVLSNTIFTNVAKTSDGGVFWEGLEKETANDVTITSWLGDTNWSKESGKPAAHPNSRFCTPAGQCPIIDPAWEDPKGVPISAILFGGRRPEGVPLIYEAFSWKHGVLVGGAMRSEATAAAEHKAKVIMHDPFAMRPFFGYNFGHYLQHWLSMETRTHKALPKIFHVNWFRKDEKGRFIWPGFGENVRVLDWILRRVDGEDVAEESAVGLLPKPSSLNMAGLEDQNIDMHELFRLPKGFWQQETQAIAKYFEEQVGDDLPNEIREELKKLDKRVEKM